MTTNSNLEKANSNDNEAVANQTTNVRPEPVSLRVRTGVRAGFSFVSKVDKASPQ